MPACGSEAACLRGLCSGAKSGLASPCSPAGSSTSNLQTSRSRLQNQNQHKQANKSSYLWRLAERCFQLLSRLFGCCLLAPRIWLSGWLTLLRFLFWLPVSLLRSPKDRHSVLISGGGTVQAVRLARNLSRAGARVVVCELEGRFGLARFSRACARYYTLPGPRSRGAAAYVARLQDIVRRERVATYVPVGAAGTAYLDSLAKPHLELLGCECLVPGAQELARIDDPLELLRRTRLLGLPTPGHRLLTRLGDAAGLYGASGQLGARYLAVQLGAAGLRPESRSELRLPGTLGELARLLLAQGPERETRPWLLLREPAGPQFVTCTTLRDSRPCANVSCRVEGARGQLVPEPRPEIERWLERFFSRGWPPGVSGHLSFRFAESDEQPGELVPLGCRVGIGLPYLGQSSAHARLLWKPCRHRARRGSLSCAEQLDPELLGKPLEKREVLFEYWDPLPYCVYCYLQLPLWRIAGLLGARHKPPLAVVQ